MSRALCMFAWKVWRAWAAAVRAAGQGDALDDPAAGEVPVYGWGDWSQAALYACLLEGSGAPGRPPCAPPARATRPTTQRLVRSQSTVVV